MRKVYLETIQDGDLRCNGYRRASTEYRLELRNQVGHSVFLIEPLVRRSVIFGVAIVDYQCDRQDRVFGKETSYEVRKGTLERVSSW